MHTKVQKWGNSLGVRIPKALADEAGVSAGSAVEVAVRDGDLVVRPRSRRRYKLSALVRRITPANRHDEVDVGPPRGKEAW